MDRSIARMGYILAATACCVAPTYGLDLTVGGMEVTQGFQSGSTPLTAGRPTMIRVTADIGTEPFGVTGVDAIVRVFVNGNELIDSPLFSENGPITALADPDPQLEDDTLNFVFIPPESNNVEFEVIVNPSGPIRLQEDDFDNNNQMFGPFDFNCRSIPEMVYVPIDARNNGQTMPNLPPNSLIRPGIGDGFIHGIFPVADWNYHRSTFASQVYTEDPGSALLGFLNDLRIAMNPIPEFIYGWWPGSISFNGQAQLGGTAAFGNTQSIRHQRTFAHEVGHNFNRVHNSRTINVVGVDVEHHLLNTQGLSRLKGPTMLDIMVAGQLTFEAWVDDETYNAFYNRVVLAICSEPPPGFAGAAPQAADDSGVLYISGVRDGTTGELNVASVIELPHVQPTSSIAGPEANLAVRSFAGSKQLAETRIVARSSGDVCDHCRPTTDSDHEPVDQPVTVAMPVRGTDGDRVDRIDFIDPATGRLVTSLQRSPASPDVTVDGVRPGDTLRGVTALTWQGNDADGDELSYWLQYSPDGRRFVPLKIRLRDNNFTFDASELPASKPGEGLLRLIVTDGFNTTTEDITGLTVGFNNAPWVDLYSPNAFTDHLQSANIILRANAWDLEDQYLDGNSVVWSSDVDGQIGTGRLLVTNTLSVGQHTITVEALDSEGLGSTDNVSVTIIERPVPLRDCNENGVDDEMDLAGGTSGDCNINNFPDECENDCDGNGIADECQSPTLVAQHPDSLVICTGQDAVFSISAPAADTYQWLLNGDPISEIPGEVEGVNTDTLTLRNVDPTDQAAYRCMVVEGCIEATSDAATLSVTTLAAIITHPPSDTTGCLGEPEFFTVAATGNLIGYQWLRNGIPLADDGRISGVNTPILTVNDLESGDEADYSCLVSNACNVVESNASTLIINDPEITTQPEDTCAELGATAEMTIDANTTVLFVSYIWRKNGNLLSDGGNISGSRTDTLVISNVSAADEATYDVVVFSTDPCIVYSDAVVLTVGGCPSCALFGDNDQDGDRDLQDLQQFTDCFGADIAQRPECDCFDAWTGDGTVGLDDWTSFSGQLTGPAP